MLVNQYSKQDSLYPVQNVFVSTDKNYYKPSETIWYGAFILNSSSYIPDYKSLFVQVLAPDNKVVLSQICKIEDDVASGGFNLPDTLSGGYYILRAYTKINEILQGANVFRKQIYIDNHRKYFYSSSALQQIRKKRRKRKRIYPKIYPRNGELLAGVTNKVYYDVVNYLGKNTKISGVLKNSKRKVITEFKSKEGRGYFEFVPNVDMRYTLFVKSKYRKAKIELPKAVRNRIFFNDIKIKNEKVIVDIKPNFKSKESTMQRKFILFARIPGKTVWYNSFNINIEKQIVTIPQSKIPVGVIRFVLFDEFGRKHAEKLFFNKKENKIRVVEKYKETADSVYANLTIIDNQNKPVNGYFSVLIKNEDKNISFANDNIENYFTINSRINKVSKDSHNEDYELLINTSSKTEYSRAKSLDYKDDEISISGTVTGLVIKTPVPGVKVVLSVLDKYNDRFVTTTDKNGKFKFDNLNYKDSFEVLIESFNSSNIKKHIINLDEYEYPQTPQFPIDDIDTEFKMMKKGRDYYLANYDYEAASKQKKVSTNSGKLHRTANKTIFFDEIDISGYTNVLPILSSYVPGISENGMSALRGRNSINLSSEPLYLIDDVPVDKSAVATMSPNDVLYVDVVNSTNAAIYGSRGANGVIAIYTKQGFNINIGELRKTILGFHAIKKFSPQEKTVFWQPPTKISSNANFSFAFKKTDNQSYFIHVQGLTDKAIPFYYMKKNKF